MKYMVRRASLWDDDIKPCDEAKKEETIGIDERTVNDPHKIKSLGDMWYTQEGYFNHRVEKGHIKRDYKEQNWVIEINSLEELNAFINKYGGIIIGYHTQNPNYKEITIYDDYVE